MRPSRRRTTPRASHRALRRTTLLAFSTLLASCASSGTASTGSPERVVLVGEEQRELRIPSADLNARATFNAPVGRVWDAIRLSYGDLGILPTVADRVQGTYGNSAFVVPRSIAGRPLREYFNCGSGPSGALIDQGRLVAMVMTTLSAAPDGAATIADTRVSATLQLNEGSSSAPPLCTSSGKLEEHLRAATERRLAAAP
jgi:hypothetical protein